MRPIYRIVYVVARAAWKLAGKWEIIGADNLPKAGPVIICPNHSSYMDPALVGAAINRSCVYMARHDLWNHKILKWLLPHLNAIPVNRKKPDRSTFRLVFKALEQGMPLVIFPEGTRSLDGRLQRAELGTAMILQKSGVPVVPVALIGPDVMLPPGALKPKRTKLKVVFGTPITFGKTESREEICDAIMRAIARLMTENGRPQENILMANQSNGDLR